MVIPFKYQNYHKCCWAEKQLDLFCCPRRLDKDQRVEFTRKQISVLHKNFLEKSHSFAIESSRVTG